MARGRGRKRGNQPVPKCKNKNIATTSTSATNGISNNFAMLSDDNSDDDDDGSLSAYSMMSKKPKQNKNLSNTNTIKPPPINVVGLTHAQVKCITDSIKSFDNDFTTKFTPTGIKISACNDEAYQKLKLHLITAKHQFFSFTTRDEQTSKFVLHGMYEMPENELIDLLKELKITPLSIKRMIIKNKKYHDHCSYVVYFRKTDKIKLSRLREIKVINNICVSWDFYQNRRRGPTQCSKCMQYGHGGRNCHLNPKCIRCGECHNSIECPYLTDPTTNSRREKIPNELIKCALCGQNHTANFSKCEVRTAFIKKQEVFRNRLKHHNKQRFNHFQPAPQLENFNFPSLTAQTNVPAWSNSSTNSTVIPPNNNLFSTSELMEIFNELMNALGKATSKTQQIAALGEVVIKYAYPQSPAT